MSGTDGQPRILGKEIVCGGTRLQKVPRKEIVEAFRWVSGHVTMESMPKVRCQQIFHLTKYGSSCEKRGGGDEKETQKPKRA